VRSTTASDRQPSVADAAAAAVSDDETAGCLSVAASVSHHDGRTRRRPLQRSTDAAKTLCRMPTWIAARHALTRR